MKAFRMAQPKTLEGAQSVAGDDARMLAGGTDLLALMKERVAEPGTVINLKSIPGLDRIEVRDDGVRIGALVTLSELASSEDLAAGWPALRATALSAATPQIRNVATVGGNLAQNPRCWYYRDENYDCLKKGGKTCPAQNGENEFHAIFENATCASVHPSNVAPVLIGYGAKLVIRKGAATETIEAEDFFSTPGGDFTRDTVLGAGDVLTHIVLPAASRSATSAYVETREKQSFDWSVCGATVNLTMKDDVATDARVVVSAVAPRPLRRRDLEELVKGKKVSDKLIDTVCEKAVTGATPLRDNGYKTILLKAVLRRAFRQAMEAAKR